MSVRFSQTLQRTYEAVRGQPWHAQLQAVTIVRDVKGQIHLFLEGYQPRNDEQAQLSQALSGEQCIGPYWTGDIWPAEGKKDRPASAMSEMIRDQRGAAPWETGASPPLWYVLERHAAKQSWTERQVVSENCVEAILRPPAPKKNVTYRLQTARSRCTSTRRFFMKIGLDEKWRLPVATERGDEHPEPISNVQHWWVIGPDGEVLGKIRVRFSDEELVLLFE